MLLETVVEYYDACAHYAAASTDGGATFRPLCNLANDFYGRPLLQRATYDADDPQAPAVTCPRCVVKLRSIRVN